MAAPCECGIGEDLRDSFTLLEHSLQAEEVSIDTLAISCPCGILQVTCDGLAEQQSTMLILNDDI